MNSTTTERKERTERGEQVARVAPPVAKHGRRQDRGFAAETAAITGESKSQINRHLRRAEGLGDNLDRIIHTSLDKGVELDALLAMTPGQRTRLIVRAVAGEKVSARKVLTMSKSTTSATTSNDLASLQAQAIGNLNAALQLLEETSTTASIVFSRALARAMRATTALKQACAQAKEVQHGK
jgi:hypothetical protein